MYVVPKPSIVSSSQSSGDVDRNTNDDSRSRHAGSSRRGRLTSSAATLVVLAYVTRVHEVHTGGEVSGTSNALPMMGRILSLVR